MVSGRSPGLHRPLLPLQSFAVGENAEQATTSQHAVQVWLTLLQALLALILGWSWASVLAPLWSRP
jgi:hypothetical protein